MKVYHGSDIRIDTIDLSKSKPGKDFGRGFYVTKLREQAEEMAKRIAHWNNSHPVINDLFTANTDDAVIQNLMTEYGFSGEKAIDIYFNSNTYRQLINEDSGLYKKSWDEVYNILLKELNYNNHLMTKK